MYSLSGKSGLRPCFLNCSWSCNRRFAAFAFSMIWSWRRAFWRSFSSWRQASRCSFSSRRRASRRSDCSYSRCLLSAPIFLLSTIASARFTLFIFPNLLLRPFIAAVRINLHMKLTLLNSFTLSGSRSLIVAIEWRSIIANRSWSFVTADRHRSIAVNGIGSSFIVSGCRRKLRGGRVTAICCGWN